MQSFNNDLQRSIDLFNTRASEDSAAGRKLCKWYQSLVNSTEHTHDDLWAMALPFETADTMTLSGLAAAYDNDTTEQATLDVDKVLKLMVAISEGLQLPISIGVQRGVDYVVSGRHRTMALALYRSVLGMSFEGAEVPVHITYYSNDARISSIIISANDSRRVRPTEKSQMLLAEAGLSDGIEALTTRPNATQLKALVSQSVLASYNLDKEGALTALTVQKLTYKWLTEFKAHPIFRLGKTPTQAELTALDAAASEFAAHLEDVQAALYRDYGNVARSVSDIAVAYSEDWETILENVLAAKPAPAVQPAKPKSVTPKSKPAAPVIVSPIATSQPNSTEDTEVDYDVVMV